MMSALLDTTEMSKPNWIAETEGAAVTSGPARNLLVTSGQLGVSVEGFEAGGTLGAPTAPRVSCTTTANICWPAGSIS